MFKDMSIDEINAACRNELNSLELWLRRIIEELLVPEYGNEYWNACDSDGQYQFNTKLRERLKAGEQLTETYFSDLSHIICRESLYKKYFSKVFQTQPPKNRQQLSGMLTCLDDLRQTYRFLKDKRNDLSHARSVTVRDAERIVCYSHDIIDAIKEYYRKMGDKDFFGPRIVSISDMWGDIPRSSWGCGIVGVNVINRTQKETLYPGDEIRISVIIDPSYEGDYTVEWKLDNNFFVSIEGQTFTHKIQNSDVNEMYGISCTVISSEESHNHGKYDDKAKLIYRIGMRRR